ARLVFQNSRQTGEIRIGRSVCSLPVEPDCVLTQINLTNGVGVVGILPRAARLGLGPGAVIVVDKAYYRRHEEDNPPRFRHVASSRQVRSSLAGAPKAYWWCNWAEQATSERARRQRRSERTACEPL